MAEMDEMDIIDPKTGKTRLRIDSDGSVKPVNEDEEDLDDESKRHN